MSNSRGAGLWQTGRCSSRLVRRYSGLTLRHQQARTLLREFQAFNDNVDELMTDIGVCGQAQVGLTDWLKTVAGLRYSRFDYDIVDNLRQPGEYVDDYSASKWQPKVVVW